MNDTQIPLTTEKPNPAAWKHQGLTDDNDVLYQHIETGKQLRYRMQPKPVASMPVTPKKLAMLKKTVTRKAILDAIEQHQPLTRRALRSQLGSAGYDLDDKDTVKRLSNMLYRMIKIGLLKQVADDILSLPDCPESKFKGVQPTKKLAREAVYAGVKTHQPAEFPIIRQALLDDGYMVAMPSGRKRLSATLSFLRKQGRLAHDRALGLWSTTEPVKPTESANPTEPKPVAAATPEPAPKPELITPEPPELPPASGATVRCKKISTTLELFDGTVIDASVDTDGIATISDGQSLIMLSLTELGHITSHLHGLRALLDDPQ